MGLHKRGRKTTWDSTVNKEFNYKEIIISQIVESSYKYFKKLNSSGYISYLLKRKILKNIYRRSGENSRISIES